MKFFLIISLFTMFNLVFFYSSKAQEIKKEEALNVIQNFYRDYVPKEKRSIFNTHIINYSFSYKDCIVEINIQVKVQHSSSTGDFSIYDAKIIIPLSKVYIDSEDLRIKSANNDIVINTKVYGKKNEHKSSFDIFHRDTLLDGDYQGLYFKDNFTENSMDQRLLNAYKSLINSCGGGTKK